MKLLKYTHPAVNKYDTKKSYKLEELKKELSDEMIRQLFTPINFKWEEKKANVELAKEFNKKQVK